MGTFRIFPPSKKRMKAIQEGRQRKLDRQAARPNRAAIVQRERAMDRIAEMEAEDAARLAKRRQEPRKR